MSSKGNQISSPPYPLPCEREVLFSKTSECQSCWKLSSWDRNKTRLECGYCCGDAEGERFYDCLTFSFFLWLLFCRCIYIEPLNTIWMWLATRGWLGTFCRFIREFLQSHVIILEGRIAKWMVLLVIELVGDLLLVSVVSAAQWERWRETERQPLF